jgi:hypothetical protein
VEDEADSSSQYTARSGDVRSPLTGQDGRKGRHAAAGVGVGISSSKRRCHPYPPTAPHKPHPFPKAQAQAQAACRPQTTRTCSLPPPLLDHILQITNTVISDTGSHRPDAKKKRVSLEHSMLDSIACIASTVAVERAPAPYTRRAATLGYPIVCELKIKTILHLFALQDDAALPICQKDDEVG